MESPESEEELYKIAQRFKGVSLLVNNVEGGKTPILQPKQLQEMGVGADDLLTQGADFDCPRVKRSDGDQQRNFSRWVVQRKSAELYPH